MPEIVLHHLEFSRSHRILWLLEELELPYELVVYRRDPATFRAPPDLRRLHPLGKAPLLVVDGEVLAESGAIIETVLERFGDGRLRPEVGTSEHTAWRYWLHYAEGSLMPPLLVKLITGRLRNARVPFFLKPVMRRISSQIDGSFTDGELKAHTAWIEHTLSRQPWFAGSAFTGADIQMSYPVEGLVSRWAADGAPQMHDWLAKVRARPAYQRALERGGEPIAGAGFTG